MATKDNHADEMTQEDRDFAEQLHQSLHTVGLVEEQRIDDPNKPGYFTIRTVWTDDTVSEDRCANFENNETWGDAIRQSAAELRSAVPTPEAKGIADRCDVIAEHLLNGIPEPIHGRHGLLEHVIGPLEILGEEMRDLGIHKKAEDLMLALDHGINVYLDIDWKAAAKSSDEPAPSP